MTRDRVAMMWTAGDAVLSAGVGLRLPHLTDVVATRPLTEWFEIHPENFLANPHAMELLTDIARQYPISVHTVGVSIGSAHGIDRDHLARVKRLIDRIDPFMVSGHLAWSTHEGAFLNDLLPLPYNEESLRLVARHLDEVQNVLGRAYLLENPSSYVSYRHSDMPEPDFLAELTHRTGCKLLCDVSNIVLSARNMGFEARAYFDALPVAAISEFHLGGFVEEALDDDGNTILIDTHSAPIADAAWELFAYAIGRVGVRPTLIEWDTDLPDFAALAAEADRARSVADLALNRSHLHAVAC